MTTPETTPKKDWRQAFVNALADVPNVARAARKAKIDRTYAYAVRREEPAFASAWDEALAVGVERMEEEAHRRAFEGTLKPVYQGGQKVGSVREFSDTLAIFLLKAHKPDKYRDNARVEIAGDQSAPLKVEHDHRVSLTADDVAFARSLVGDAGAGVPPDGGPSPG